MQNRRGQGGFDPFEGFGFGGNLMSSFFGGRDPFDDPFFTRPFGSMLGPSLFGSDLFGSSMFGPRLMDDSAPSGFIEQRPHQVRSRGPVIEELSSDDEADKDKEKKENTKKHSRPDKEPFIVDPDEEVEDKRGRHLQLRNDYSKAGRQQPQTRNFSFQSSTVTYGGTNGAYYTASTTRRAGGDGVIMEERKEADSTTGRAAHRISRGIHDKGHSVTRKLNEDGRVDTVQMLHNLNEDELSGFEEAWKGNAKKHLPGWEQGSIMNESMYNRASSSRQNEQRSHGWALPSTERVAADGQFLRNRHQEKGRDNKFSHGRVW